MQPAPPPPGWHPDPHQPGLWRWWDGTQWTAQTAPMLPAHPVAPPQDLGQSPVMRALLPVGRPWQAIVAGYVGLFAIFIVFLGPIAIGFGVWGIQAGGHGKGRSIFGIVAGVWGTVWTLWFATRR